LISRSSRSPARCRASTGSVAANGPNSTPSQDQPARSSSAAGGSFDCDCGVDGHRCGAGRRATDGGHDRGFSRAPNGGPTALVGSSTGELWWGKWIDGGGRR
jgi:hypothetical protein